MSTTPPLRVFLDETMVWKYVARWLAALTPPPTAPPARCHGWKPRTLQPFFLLPVMSITAFLIIGLEISSRKSVKDHGVVIADSEDDMPAIVGVWNWVPGIATILYNIVWVWIDFDVKRMEPWFSLSQKKGALAEDSLFIGYLGVFRPGVWTYAWRSRHWRVVMSSMICFLCMTIVSPLTATAITTKDGTMVTYGSSYTSPGLQSASDQDILFDQSMLIRLFGTVWFDYYPPAYTTTDFALLPFRVHDDAKNKTPGSSAISMTGRTTRYWSEMVCAPALSGHSGNASWYATGPECNITNLNIPFAYRRSVVSYIGWPCSGWQPFCLERYASAATAAGGSITTCPSSIGEGLSLIVAAQRPLLGPVEKTALFCTKRYYSEPVEATVTLPSLRPSTFTATGPSSNVSQEIFNALALERLLASPTEQDRTAKDYIFRTPIRQSTQMSRLPFNLSQGSAQSPMVGFALGLNRSRHFTDYLNASVLASSFDAGQKALFSFALAKAALEHDNGVRRGDGSWKSSYNAVVLYRTLTLIVEVALGIILSLAIALAISCYRAPCHIGSNPSSLLQMVLDLTGQGPQLTEFSQCGHLTRSKLVNKFAGTRYRLVCRCDPLSVHGRLQRVDRHAGPRADEISEEGMTAYKPYFPPVLQPWVGVLFMCAISGLWSLIIFLAVQSRDSWGILPPYAQEWRNSILFTYIPTHIGTFIEPFFGLVNQSLAMSRSISQLERRGQSNEHTVGSRYMSIPPQFNIARAVRVRDYKLTVSCLMTFLASALSVALSMLLKSADSHKPVLTAFSQSYSSFWNTTVLSQYSKNGTPWGPEYLDPVYLLYAYNQSTVSPYPWTINSTYFTPVNLPSGTYDYAIFTIRGFTPDFICVNTSEPPVQSIGTTLPNLTYSFPPDELKTKSCTVSQIPETKPVMPYAYDGNLTGAAASEGFTVLSEYGGSCGIVFGWYWTRWSAYGSPNGTATTSSMACKAGVRTAMYEVQVDASGYILTWRQLDGNYFQSMQEHVLKTSEIMSLIINMWGGQGSSNLSVATTGLGSLLHKAGNNSLFDPKAAVPDMHSTAKAIRFQFRALVVQFFAMNPSVHQAVHFVVHGGKYTVTKRQSVGDAPLRVAIIILSIAFVGLLAVYLVHRLAFKIPRPIDSLGSLLAYTALSRGFLAEGDDSEGDNRFGFGVYTGSDGRVQFGIDSLRNLRNLPGTGKP